MIAQEQRWAHQTCVSSTPPERPAASLNRDDERSLSIFSLNANDARFDDGNIISMLVTADFFISGNETAHDFRFSGDPSSSIFLPLNPRDRLH